MLRIFWTLTALVSALAGAGYWNYQRNAHLDRDEQPRPYRTLSDEELGLLEEAYTEELAEYSERVERYARASASTGAGASSSASAEHMDLRGNIDAFARVQQRAEGMREAQREKRERQYELEQIQRERSIRQSGLDDPFVRFKKRLLSF